AIVHLALEPRDVGVGAAEGDGRVGAGDLDGVDRDGRRGGVDVEPAGDGGADVAGGVDGAHRDGVVTVRQAGELLAAGAGRVVTLVELALEPRHVGVGAGEVRGRGRAGHVEGVDRRGGRRRVDGEVLLRGDADVAGGVHGARGDRVDAVGQAGELRAVGAR